MKCFMNENFFPLSQHKALLVNAAQQLANNCYLPSLLSSLLPPPSMRPTPVPAAGTPPASSKCEWIQYKYCLPVPSIIIILGGKLRALGRI